MSTKKNIVGCPGFNWDMYENWNGGNNLRENTKVKSTYPGCKVFSHEPYASELVRIYDKQDTYASKDLEKGQYITITKLTRISDTVVSAELFGGINVNVDLTREKRFITLFDINTISEFIELISDVRSHDELIGSGIKAYVTEGGHNPRISLMQGYSQQIKDQMMEQIRKPSKAYVAKITSANRGGYFVDILGVNAFMPGSLAAANKIIDFQSMVGKEVVVMVEDFIANEDSFIVSHKKYIDFVLPTKLKELDTNIKHTGYITGTSKYGIFIEFGELFTGLLHVSKMTECTRKQYENKEYKPGQQFEFYIDEIGKDNRIILSEESPIEKLNRLKVFTETIKDKKIEVKVVNIVHAGIIVSCEDNLGMISTKELKKHKLSAKNLSKGDILNVVFDTLEDSKLCFKLPV